MRVFSSRSTAVAVACSALVLVGCKSRPEARYVMRSGDGGVIAMPADTPENRERAAALMQSHLPEGYEIVAEGEEAVLAPAPPSAVQFHGPIGRHGRWQYDPVAAAAWTEPEYQREVESLPGTPQSMEGYARQQAPPVGLHFGQVPSPSRTVLRSEWRIAYRKKDSSGAGRVGGEPESLFPAERTSVGEESAPNVGSADAAVMR